MSQDWRDLTYLHWAVPPARVADRMPPGVSPDVLDGVTYVGLVPFRMVDAAPARLPGVPWLGTFLETNVRLYSIDATGRRGVVFLSLDTDRLPIVLAARGGFGVPYRWARMRHRRTSTPTGAVHEYTARLRRPARAADRPTSRIRVEVGAARASTPLDDFLTARWGLHTAWPRRTRYVPNAHGVWPLRETRLLDLEDQLLGSVGLGDVAEREPDHVAFSDGVHTEFGMPVDATRPRDDRPDCRGQPSS